MDNWRVACQSGADPKSSEIGRQIDEQLLDGVGAGIFVAITPLVVDDLMRGTGFVAAAARLAQSRRPT